MPKHIFVVKICNVCLKRLKINKNEAGVYPFFKKTVQTKLKVIEHQLFLLGVEDIQDKIENLIDSGPWMESILNVFNHRGLICFAWILGIFLSIKLNMY